MLKKLAIQSGVMKDLKANFPHSWSKILSPTMFFVIYPEQNLANYDATAGHCDFPLSSTFLNGSSQSLLSSLSIRLACCTKENSSNYWHFHFFIFTNA